MNTLEPFSLILDDYHVIEEPSIHQAIDFLLEHQPPQLHLVILTRIDPPLPLSRLRARAEDDGVEQLFAEDPADQ